jgi:type II secretory ATPase GspE/PulE/Tfp pilus assembly ATPase PilB-like protein/ActR/RegA family two-component response regulator
MHKQVCAVMQAVPAVGRAGFPALLMDRGFISRSDLIVAQQHADRERMELADAFVSLGLVEESDCYTALAEAAGLELVDAVERATSELAIRLVPERLARRYVVVPLSVDNRTLTYATCRPFDPEVERDLAFASGRRLSASVAPRSGVLEALERCYPKLRELDVLAARLSGERSVVEGPVLARTAPPSGSTVIELCDHMIARAVEVGASDVHVECGNEGTTVRYRICGVLEPVLTLPASVSSSILNRFKIMARADIAIHHRPQDGAFQIKINGRPIDVRLSTLPIVQGEKIVMRVIDSYSPLQTLDRLFYDDETLARLCQSLARPDGLILVTGPTGSGKTTALYAALAHLRTGRTNIVSVEDPVERTVEGVTQIPVNPRGGNTFATVLRSLMRQDPNVIMVGEIRDEEVAQIVGQAAYTGHLVLTSMHTVDASTAITRLANLGLEPYKIAESLCAVLAQRLLRSLCPSCKRVHTGEDAHQSGPKHGTPLGPASAGSGCQHCNHTGYLGRVPVAELLTPSESLRAAISAGAGAHEIRAAMRAAGYPTMRDRALQLVAAGVTSIEEVNRVLSDDDSARNMTRDRPRILVVDDDAITRMLVKLLLERDRFEVLEAANGRDAVEIAARERPDLLIIDLNMPEMDGYQAIATLRKDLSLAMLPIVVLTSEEGPGIERRVLELGADDYILKPFDPDVLLSRVNAVFRRLKVAAA